VVRDGQITVWRDCFDWLDLSIAIMRGLAGMLIPAANRSLD